MSEGDEDDKRNPSPLRLLLFLVHRADSGFPRLREHGRPLAVTLRSALPLGDWLWTTSANADSDRLDHYHRLERERIRLLLLEDVKRGLADIAAGRSGRCGMAIALLQQARKPVAKTTKRRG